MLLDLEGPEIRTGSLQNDLQLEEGDIITVSVGNEDAEISSFSIDYEDLINTLNEGDKISVDSGLINLEILNKKPGHYGVQGHRRRDAEKSAPRQLARYQT